MPTLEEVARETDLSDRDIEHIHGLLGWWQLIADLSFADLALWGRRGPNRGFACIGQMRPYTAQTLHPEDLFGAVIRPEEIPIIDRAFLERKIVSLDEPVLIDGVSVRMEATPVTLDGSCMAVMTQEGAPLMHRRPGQLEENYIACGAALTLMVHEGVFPFAGDSIDHESLPRVGDGVVRLDGEGRVLYASPNAVSALRRLGTTSTIIGETLADLHVDDELSRSLAMGSPTESASSSGSAVVTQHLIPFLDSSGEVLGGLMLLRDVTELRHQERVIQRKEAVIKEIHHRVKNNLQTIASLLRIQARRLTSDEARRELEEAVARVAAIAVVHETLSEDSSESVEFEIIARRIITMVSENLVLPDRRVEFTFEGEAGSLPPEMATAVAVVLVELLQNAAEHAFEEGSSGHVKVQTKREGDRVQLVVADDGKGLPEGFDLGSGGLGLQIVKTLAIDELAGSIQLESSGGTRITVDLEVKQRA
jgi:two-component sensor histidine kinase